jgi:hypothetical protein
VNQPTAIDEWVRLFASRDELAQEYATLLRTRPANWGGWPALNLAVVARWSESGLAYVKRQAWKIAEGQA